MRIQRSKWPNHLYSWLFYRQAFARIINKEYQDRRLNFINSLTFISQKECSLFRLFLLVMFLNPLWVVTVWWWQISAFPGSWCQQHYHTYDPNRYGISAVPSVHWSHLQVLSNWKTFKKFVFHWHLYIYYINILTLNQESESHSPTCHNKNEMTLLW